VGVGGRGVGVLVGMVVSVGVGATDAVKVGDGVKVGVKVGKGACATNSTRRAWNFLEL